MNDQTPQEMPNHSNQPPEIEIQRKPFPGVGSDIHVTVNIIKRVPTDRRLNADQEPDA